MCIALTMLLCSLEVSANSMVSYPLQSADTTIVIVPDSTSPKPYVVIVDGDTLQPNRLTEDVAYENVLEEERAKQRRVPVNTFSASMGYGWITSKIVTNMDTYKGYGGMDLKIEYNWVGKNGYGFGFIASVNSVDYPHERVVVGLIAPSFIMATKLSDKWIVRGRVSIGYSWHGPALKGGNGIGTEVSYGAEYMLNKIIGLGAEIHYYRATYPAPDTFDTGINERYGVDVIGILAGVRVYF